MIRFIYPLLFISMIHADLVHIVSPEKNISATLSYGEKGRLLYRVDFNQKRVIEPSELGIIVGGVDLGLDIEIGKPAVTEVDESYETRGKHTQARNHFINYRFPIQHKQSQRRFHLDFRLFNDGVAYRYVVPGKGIQHVDGERSSWKIIPGAKAWYFERLTKKWKLKSYAGEWVSTEIEKLDTATPKKIGRVQGTPIVLELPDEIGFAAVTKAATYNYSGMRLNPIGDRVLVADFTEGGDGFDVDGTITTPWRVTMLAEDLNGLVNSDIINNLNPAPDPVLFADTSYIKPGRSAWSWESIGLGTPKDQKQYIDYASEMGFEYSTVDDGWKDWDQPWETMKSLADYGRGKKVGVFLWVDSKDIRDPADDYLQMRKYFDKVAASGAVGLKIDFMNSEAKEMVDFEIAVLQNAAKRKLVINFHGCHASTGEERTYPNELTREGIRGMEVNKHKDGPLPISHNAALPFTRFLVGQADYTPILFTNPGPTSFAHQLATLVPYTTGLQTYAEFPPTMMTAPAVMEAFPIIRAIPSVWDETRVLDGSKIGDLAAIARRSGDDWFVGILNGGAAREYDLALSFLGDGIYKALLVQDDLEGAPVNVIELGINMKAMDKRQEWTTATPLQVTTRSLDHSKRLAVKMAKGGGFVVWFKKG